MESEGTTRRIGDLIMPLLTQLGYELVRVQLTGARRPVLQIMAERVDRVPMTVADCQTISTQLSALLDVADPIASSYELEVSSPGIDRPLTRPADFDRFAGHEARIETSQPQGEPPQRRFSGVLLGRAVPDGDAVRLQTERGEVTIPLAHIARAKLVLTERLLAAGQA